MITSMKKKIIILMAAVMTLSVFCIPAPQAQAAETTTQTTVTESTDEASLAASASAEYKEIPLAKDGRVKVGGYYYYMYDSSRNVVLSFKTKSSVKILRSKTKSGKGTVIYKDAVTSVHMQFDIYDDYEPSHYYYPYAAYTNGKYIIYGFLDTTTFNPKNLHCKMYFYRTNADGTGNAKKIASFTETYYSRSDSWKKIRTIGAYGKYLYYWNLGLKKADSHVYRMNIFNGKKTHVKVLDSMTFHSETFDGRYFYIEGTNKAYDCKTLRTVKTSKKINQLLIQDDGLYMAKLTANKKSLVIYKLKNKKFCQIAKITPGVKIKSVNTVITDKGVYTGKRAYGICGVNSKYVYVSVATSSGDCFYRYNRKTKKCQKVTESTVKKATSYRQIEISWDDI